MWILIKITKMLKIRRLKKYRRRGIVSEIENKTLYLICKINFKCLFILICLVFFSMDPNMKVGLV